MVKRDLRKMLVSVLVLMSLGIVVLAEDISPPATAPTTRPKPESPARALRLVQPWKDLNSLTDEQRLKIYQIHLEANAAKKAIDQKERTDILAILNEQNIAELNEQEARKTVERKLKEAERKAKEAETE